MLVPSAEGEPRARWSWSALPRVGLLPSSEAEMWGAVEGLGAEASSEAEIAPRVRGGFGWAVPRSWAVGRLRIGPLEDLERI